MEPLLDRLGRPAVTAVRKPEIPQRDCVGPPPPRRIEYGRMNTLEALTGRVATLS